MRRWGTFCLLTLWLCGSAAWAQELRWQATVGFGNLYKEGAWTPVFVDLSNEGASAQGRLVVPISYRPPAARKVNYAVAVDLPRHSKKQYTLYAPSEGLENIFLELPGGRAKKALGQAKAADPEDTLVVVIGGDRGLLSFLTGVPAVNEAAVPGAPLEEWAGPTPGQEKSGEIQVGHTDWDRLPDSWLGWEGVDAVVLGDAGFKGASEEGIAALLRWVELGGTLIVPGGTRSAAMAAGPVGRLLPLKVTGTAVLPSLEALGAWVDKSIDKQPVLAATGALVPATTVLCGSQTQPLIATRKFGSGRVVMTAFDFGAAPVKYWDGQSQMWPRLLSRSSETASLAAAAERRSPYMPMTSLPDAAVYTPAARLPPMWLILGFLAAYIIVLVPVNYLVLKRFDRRELAWVTTPIIVVVFTLGAYAAGYGMRGGSVILNRLGVVETTAGVGLAHGRGYVGLFSPARTTYELLLGRNTAGARDLAPAEERSRGQPTVLYGPKPKITDIAMNMWTSRALCVEFLADLGKGITGQIEYDGTGLRAKVKNGTPLRLKKCRIVNQGQQGLEKDLAPGQEATLTFAKSTPIGRGGPSYRRTRGGQVQQEMEALALEALFEQQPSGYYGPYGGPQKPAVGPVLAAISDDPLVDVKVAGKRPKVNDKGIIIVRLPVRLTAGKRISVPRWLVSKRMIGQAGTVSYPARYRGTGGYSIDTGHAVFELAVPLGLAGGKAAALAVTATPVSPGAPPTSRPSGAPPAAVYVWAYNFALGRWDRLPGTVPTVSFPKPWEYMTPDGRVHVKIEVPAGAVEFAGLDLDAEVRTF